MMQSLPAETSVACAPCPGGYRRGGSSAICVPCAPGEAGGIVRRVIVVSANTTVNDVCVL